MVDNQEIYDNPIHDVQAMLRAQPDLLAQVTAATAHPERALPRKTVAQPAQTRPAALLVAISDWVDNANSELSPGEADWSRIGKVAEEVGEVVAAYYGATGQNPRKGVTGTMSDVVEELLDVAVVALGAIEHFTGHSGSALDMLDDKVVRIAQRAGLL